MHENAERYSAQHSHLLCFKAGDGTIVHEVSGGRWSPRFMRWAAKIDHLCVGRVASRFFAALMLADILLALCC